MAKRRQTTIQTGTGGVRLPARSGETPAQAGERSARLVRAGHHFNEDLACPACGTDSSVGCIAGAE